MSNNAIEISKYQFSHNDTLLVDACVWLRLYGPQSGTYIDRKTTKYSDAMKRILLAKSSMFVDVLIISEFINRYSRLEFQLQNTSGSDKFKTYRNSSTFQPVAKAIADAVRRILNHSQRIGNGFESLNINALLNDYETAKYDFNDQILAHVCKVNGFKLITDDSDFRNSGIVVLTANPRLV